MTRDVEDLLHRDAASWRSAEPDPPSLDDALDGALRDATATPRRIATWAAVAASVLVVAALAVAFGVWRAHRSPEAPAGPAPSYPSTIQYRGETLYANPGRYIDAVVVDRAHPRQLTVLTSSLDKTGKGPCLDAHPVVQVLTQDASAVRLDLITYKRKPPAEVPSTYYCGFSSFAGVPEMTEVRITLAQPLSRSAVVRDARGRAAAVVDPSAEPPTPARVPSGYLAGQVARADPAHGRYAATRSYRHDSNTLVIRAGYVPDEDAGRTSKHANVGRYRATITREGSASCVSWTDARGDMLQVCAGGPQSTRLTDAQLLVVARSLQ